MADAENRLQNAVTDMMRRLNVSRLRPIQKQTYLNMAACLDKHPQGKIYQIKQLLKNYSRCGLCIKSEH